MDTESLECCRPRDLVPGDMYVHWASLRFSLIVGVVLGNGEASVVFLSSEGVHQTWAGEYESYLNPVTRLKR